MQDGLGYHRETAEEVKPTLDLSEGGWKLINFRDVEQAVNEGGKYCWYTKNEDYVITRDNGERKEYEKSQYEKIVLPEKLLPKTVISILDTLGLDKALEAGGLTEASRKCEEDGKPHWFINKKRTTIGVCSSTGGKKPTTKYYPLKKKTYSI